LTFIVLDAVSSSTSTANAEYEYEKSGKTSIETPKHANSATSTPLATSSTMSAWDFLTKTFDFLVCGDLPIVIESSKRRLQNSTEDL
jgi:hypothetical protein